MELKDIKKIRGSAGITQNKLAKLSGVSQALISRIEAGVGDPAYSSVMKIFHAIESVKINCCAKDIMTKRVYSIRSSDKIAKAVKIMKSRKISQLPVIDDELIVGMVGEREVSYSLLNKKIIVKEIMSEAPPIVGKSIALDMLTYLLDTSPAVIVYDDGKMVGIVTRADIMKMIKK